MTTKSNQKKAIEWWQSLSNFQKEVIIWKHSLDRFNINYNRVMGLEKIRQCELN